VGSRTLSMSIFLLKLEKCDWICNPLNSSAPDFRSIDMEQNAELVCNGDFERKFFSDNMKKF
jgi:hypothetical protein